MNGFFTVNALACLLVATAVLVTLTKTPAPRSSPRWFWFLQSSCSL